jgi:integrase
MACMGFVQKHPKSGVYRVRRKIPPDARMAFGGRKIFLQSLGTKDPLEAKRLALPVLVELDRKIAHAQTQGGFWATHDLGLYLGKFKVFAGLNQEETISFEEINRTGGFDFPSEQEFLKSLLAFCQSHSVLAKPDQWQFRQYVETKRRYTVGQPEPRSDRRYEPQTILLSELEERLIQQGSYAKRSEQDVRKAFEYLRQIRTDVPADQIIQADIRELRDLLLRYPVLGRTKSVGLREAAQQNHQRTMNPKTVRKLLGFLSKGFQLAHSEGWATGNPVLGIQVAKKTATSKDAAREDFTPGDLTRLFNSDWFLGKNDRDYKFWLPWLGLFTGARLSELTQLGLDDLRKDQGIWYLSLTTTDGKRLKTKNSVRMIPLHPRLIQMGFPEWARTGLPWKHRYPDAEILSREFSKQFARHLTRIGLKRTGLVFHSFRHTFKSAGRMCGMIEDLNDVLTGHLPQTVAGKYGRNKRPVETLLEQIQKLDFEGLPK